MRSGVTRKALAVGILLILLNSFWTIQHHEKFYASWSIFYNVIFILFMLTLLNFALRRLHSRAGFNQGELLTIYVMLCLATSVGAKDTIQALPPIMTRPFHFATPENEWKELFWILILMYILRIRLCKMQVNIVLKLMQILVGISLVNTPQSFESKISISTKRYTQILL